MCGAEGRGPRLALILSLVVFSGAVFEPLILGAETTNSVSRASRALNSAPYLPLYLAGLIMVLRSTSALGRLLPVFLPYMLFAAYMGLSLLWSADPLRSLIDFSQLLGTIAVAVGLALCLRPEGVVPLMARVFLILLALSLLFVVFLPGIGRMQTTEFSVLNGLPQGVFGHKNQYGEMAALGLALAVAGGSALSLALRTGLVGVSIAGLFLAQSSANLMAIVLTLTLFLTWRMAQKHASGPSFWLIVMGFLGLAFVLALPELVGPLLELAGKDATLTGRIHIWAYAGDLIAARPLLGYGLGSVWTMHLPPVDGFVSF